MKSLSFFDRETKPITYSPEAGVLITEEMDAEIDRLLPAFGEKYTVAREEKKQHLVGVFQFSNPYNSSEWSTPLLVDYEEGENAPLGWASHSVAVNAAVYEDLKDWMRRRVIAHELIHVIDPTRRKWPRYRHPREGMDKYLEQDAELNAYSGMMGYSFRKNAKTWRGTEHHQGWVDRLRESLVVLEDPRANFDAKVYGAFDPYYSSVLSEYQKILTPDRFTLFAGRVSLGINDALAHLAGDTETPFVRLEAAMAA